MRVSCPKLTSLTDKSFGATARKLKQVADQYYECRAAALQEDGIVEPEKQKKGN